MTWLVTGGAGYIGSHVVRAFRDRRASPAVVIDDLSSGHRGFVPRRTSRSSRAACSTRDAARPRLRRARRRRRRAPRRLQVRRCLGRAAAAHLHPERHRHGHPAGGDGRARRRTRSSSPPAPRVYGTPDVRPGHRGDPDQPRVAVRRVEAGRRVAAPRPGHGADAACATPRCATSTSSARASDDLHDTSPHNLFPLVFEQLVAGEDAPHQRRRLPHPGRHLRPRLRPRRRPRRLARRRRQGASTAGGPLEPVYNLGSGDGLSVRQIMDAVARVTGIDFTPEIAPAAPGRPGPHRRHRRAGRARPRLEDAAHGRRHGRLRLGGSTSRRAAKMIRSGHRQQRSHRISCCF